MSTDLQMQGQENRVGQTLQPSKAEPIHNWLTMLHETVSSCEARLRGEPASFASAISAVQDVILQAKQKGATIWWVGNGGSNAICLHLSQDLLNKLQVKSQPICNPALITCMANDFGYENVYVKPLESLFNSRDVLIAISSSGNSANILKCVELAHSRGGDVITLSGFLPTNRLWNTATRASFYLSSRHYGIVEVGHEAILHGAIETLYEDSFKSANQIS